MPILTRYLLKEILKLMVAIFIVVVFIYLFIDFIEKSGRIFQSGLPAQRIFMFLSSKFR